ncbi:MAG: IS4 family transposase [Endozoicomonas sp.]|uniref:IS4 family transposase n=1 Tax=Endozoicomonas sp. TaxID=1892382 RepID=UPI003D9B5A03
MKHNNNVFQQLLKAIPRHPFQKVVDRHNGDHRARKLSCWTQLVAMIFVPLTSRISIRDLVENFNANHNHHYHLGVSQIKRSSLSDANNQRSASIFTATFFFLLQKVRKHLPRGAANDMVRLINSTTIDLNLNQFEWAHFRKTKGGIKLHTVYDPDADTPTFFELTTAKVNDRKAAQNLPIMAGVTYVFDRAYDDYSWYYEMTNQGTLFVGRMKSSAVYTVIETREITDDFILEDQVIRLSSDKARKDCPTDLRRVKIRREEDGKLLVFISNDLDRTAAEIAVLYKSRWQIELFFKWIKQNLKIKRFIGRSENAVKIQILTAMIAYLLLRLVQLNYPVKSTLQQIARKVNLNLMVRRSIADLLSDPPEQRASVTPPVQNFLELKNA